MKAVSGPISRLLPGLAAAVFALLFLRTSGCRRYIPEVFGPQSTYQGAPTAFRLTIASARGNIDFVVDWGDGTGDTLWDHSPGDTVSALHTWSDVGSHSVKAMAMLTGENHTYTEWSSAHEVEILPNGVPTADFDAPIQARVDVEMGFTVWGTDPDGEDVAFQMVFGDDTSGWTESVDSGDTATVTREFSTAGETLEVRARAKDSHGTVGPWSDPATVITTDAGRMSWWTDKDSLWPSTATVVVEYNGTEYVYFGTDDGYFRIYGVDFATGKSRISGTNLFPELENRGWSNHPAYNENTGHIVIAHGSGELHAFDLELNRIWTFPGAASPAYLTSTEWGQVCIAVNNIYVPNLDTIIRGSDTIDKVTKFYKIPDSPDRPVDPPFAVLGVQEVRGAPAADASGNVFFVTDSGYLYKLDSDLVEQWRALPGNSRRLYGPVVGSGGAVFCGDDEGKVYAFNPDGERKWEQTLTGVREMYMVVGNQYLFAACDNGYVFALDPGTGSEVWDKRVSTAGGFVVYPILTANRLMYVLDDNTKLFCIEQATGNKLWDIACTDYYRGRPGTDGVVDPKPSPTL
ncbi:MAG: PQQ-binding-like beta-propeller repeat protein, partial [candidate division WOR-3 bacterium]